MTIWFLSSAQLSRVRRWWKDRRMRNELKFLSSAGGQRRLRKQLPCDCLGLAEFWVQAILYVSLNIFNLKNSSINFAITRAHVLCNWCFGPHYEHYIGFSCITMHMLQRLAYWFGVCCISMVNKVNVNRWVCRSVFPCSFFSSLFSTQQSG